MFFVLPCLLLCSASLFASTAPSPADYTVDVHVTASRVELVCNAATPSCSSVLFVDAVIDGQKYQLEVNIQSGHAGSDPAGSKRENFSLGKGFLALGDYKAKLRPGDAKDPNVPYYVIKNYEILFADGRLAEFQVIGQTG
jgi:hypothetical protein